MISKNRAIEIAKKLYGTRSGIDYSVSESSDSNITIYGKYDWPNIWLVKVSTDHGVHILESTTIVLIRKDTGEVLFNGDAMDEG